MILYGIIILVCMALIALFNALFAVPMFGFSVLYAALATVILTAAVIALDGLFAFLIRRLPEKFFSHKRTFFTVSQKEKLRYEKLGIRKWKDKIPELGGFTGLRKNKIDRPYDNAYLSRYLTEACYGVTIHLVTVFTGYLIIFICPLRYWLCFGFPIATVNAVLNVLPIFVLRYNTYKLNVLYLRNERRNMRTQIDHTPDCNAVE